MAICGLPERTVDILLDAITDPDGTAGCRLCMENEYSRWSVFQGVGRAARKEFQLKVIFDELIENWEKNGGGQQDKSLLAAVSHPMARRVAVRRVLSEDKVRFDRVKGFLDRQLENILDKNHDLRPNGKRRQPQLELRYVVMGYRGLCQVRYNHSDWFPFDGDECKVIHDKLRTAVARVRNSFVQTLVERTAPYLIGEGQDPSIPGGF